MVCNEAVLRGKAVLSHKVCWRSLAGINLYAGPCRPASHLQEARQHLDVALALRCFLRRWYSQAGTPELAVSTEYNPSDSTYTIRTKQVRGWSHGTRWDLYLSL